MLDLDCSLEFHPERAEREFFPVLPQRPAVCLIELREGAEPYFIRTQDLKRRLGRLLGPADPASKRLNLSALATGVRFRVTGSRFEQTLAYYQHARQLFPKRYRDLLRLRPPAVLKVNLRNAYPRCYVTRRIPAGAGGEPAAGIYYGPFASRKSAEAFALRFLDFFKVRRCQIKIRRDPAFPGCLYSEMKMCLAPCFAGCSKEEYDGEVGRMVQFLLTSGGSLRARIEAEREEASEALDFEAAAALHKKVEKLDDALRARPELARPIQDLDALILQRASENQTIGFYAVRGGRLLEPFLLRFGEMASQPKSAERTIRDYLETAAPGPDGDLSEHLWLLARWYYSNPREGEIFFREKDWPYRRILRACSRVLSPGPADPERSGPPTEPGRQGDP